MPDFLNANTIASIAAPIVTGIIGFFFAKMSKGHDARAAAEAALIGTGPTIIANQNNRIKSLEETVSNLWSQIGETLRREQNCQRDLGIALQQVHVLEARVLVLENQLGIEERADGLD